MIWSPRVAAVHLWLAVLCMTAPGCIAAVTHHAIPVCDLDGQTLPCGSARNGLVPIDFGLLGQPKPHPRTLMPGDVVSVYIEGVLPSAPLRFRLSRAARASRRFTIRPKEAFVFPPSAFLSKSVKRARSRSPIWASFRPPTEPCRNCARL